MAAPNPPTAAKRPRARELGIVIGTLTPGRNNTITDVQGVTVGHRTVLRDPDVRTGVTVVVPHQGNLYQLKTPAALYVGNGFGKLAGSTQLDELGTLETPLGLTNTLSVPAAITGLIRHTLLRPGNETVRSVNAVVGEINDGLVSDIRGMHVTAEHIAQALHDAAAGHVAEGSVGAGAGAVAFGYKAGIGSSSRQLPTGMGGYTLGVLVLANYGGALVIAGTPLGGHEAPAVDFAKTAKHLDSEGSCIIVVATDAPLDARQLRRVAKRALIGVARTGSIMEHGSGDYAIAFSTAYFVPHTAQDGFVVVPPLLADSRLGPLFRAAADASEEAVLNALLAAESITARDGTLIEALPIDSVLEAVKHASQ